MTSIAKRFFFNVSLFAVINYKTLTLVLLAFPTGIQTLVAPKIILSKKAALER